MAKFTERDIRKGLQKLGELAVTQGVHIHLVAVGGTVMVLSFGVRQSTRDVDVVILTPPEARIVRELAARVADEYGWVPDWLNDGAKGYLRGISEGPVIFQAPGIEVQAPSFVQLLAMKLSAWRDEVDISDARRILQEVAPNYTRDELWQEIEPFLVPGDELTAQYAFLDLWDVLYGTN